MKSADSSTGSTSSTGVTPQQYLNTEVGVGVELESQTFVDDPETASPSSTESLLLSSLQPPQDPLPDMSEWNEFLRRLQRIAVWVSHILALFEMVIVIWWIQLLGGLGWKAGQASLVFNWHPLGMIAAFCFMTVASLSFRLQRGMKTSLWPRQQIKLLHLSAWAVAAASALVATVAVFQSHNDAQSGYIANLYSLHSWIGVAVILLYVNQFIAGVVTFWWPLSWMTPLFKAQVMSIHTYLGTFLYTATAATILTGIQEKEGFYGCSYRVKAPDYFPPLHFSQIPLPCRVSHLLGVLVFCMTASTSFALQNIGGQARMGAAKDNKGT